MSLIRKEPITITVVIDTPDGSYSVSKTQLRDPQGKPVQSLSGLWKDTLADVNPIVRRHDTVVA